MGAVVAGLSAAVCLALSVLAPIRAGADPMLAPVAHTDAGDVAAVLDDDVWEWRAIPYAAPPVGQLRWRPPAPPSPWADVRFSTDFAPQCVQLVDSDTSTAGSEDCLYLNVFAPAGTTAADRLPVMVHLHGGGNFFFRAYQHADTFVQRGVIVVTLGYRLGVMGFAGHPELTEEGGGSSGEYGLLDQVAALHWVQDNIAAFGATPAT